MKPFRKAVEEEGAKVPAYIVTFSDMTTLLLTFFVMLLSLAEMQDPEIFNRGRDAFWKSIRQQGLGLLSGGMEEPFLGYTKIKYFINEQDENFEDRSVDAKEEDIRRIFKKLERSTESMPSRIVAKKTDFSVTSVNFSPGDASLNEAGKKYLVEFCSDLEGGNFAMNREGDQQGADFGGISLYVLGLAGDETDEKDQWILSARRARAAAGFIMDTLNSSNSQRGQGDSTGRGSKWPVYWWGAGQGGDWVAEGSPISSQSQILIAVLRTDE